MSKNLEELKKIGENEKDFKSLRLQDFEKRLTELEKFKGNVLEYNEINETGGVNNIKIGGLIQIKKERRK